MADRTIPVRIPAAGVALDGEVIVPDAARGIALFAHGSGSSRFSPRNQRVAGVIRQAGVATLLFDLLTPEEEPLDARTRHLRFDIPMLARRLLAATTFVESHEATARLRVGYFGSSTGGGAALVAAAERGAVIGAVVSRGGRPDLAGDALPRVASPTLLVVGGLDVEVLRLNQEALERLRCEKVLKVVPGATHLFEEPGALDEVARLAAEWLSQHLVPVR